VLNGEQPKISETRAARVGDKGEAEGPSGKGPRLPPSLLVGFVLGGDLCS